MRRIIILAVMAVIIFSFTYGCGNTDTTSGSPENTGAGTLDRSEEKNKNTNIDTTNKSSFGQDTIVNSGNNPVPKTNVRTGDSL